MTLRSVIEQLVEDAVTEMNTTSTVGGEYNTPYAFTDPRGEDERDDDIEKQTKSLGFSVVQEALAPEDLNAIQQLVRNEVAIIFYDLFRKRQSWT